MLKSLDEAIEILKKGGIIAYPTEAVYGLGCDPFNESAVLRLLELKKRSVAKGLIIIAANWQQLQPYIQPVDTAKMATILSWPTPITWIFPATMDAPKWVTGSHTTIAVRVTTHPIANKLCQLFGKPIISTSANLEGKPPAKSADEIKPQFPTGIDIIIPGELGNLDKPTEIREAITGKILRSQA
jgi:L-threonylcarbamoyladenylate synthase